MSRHWFLIQAALLGCSSPGPVPEPCPAEAAEALVNGTTRESYLGLSSAELRAVVQVAGGTEPDAPLCSGVFVAPEWVLTAQHCLVIESSVVIAMQDGAPPRVVDVRERAPHPDLDVALLRVDVPASDLGIQPLGLAESSRAVGDAVELAGYGLTETGETRTLGFLVEPIVAVEHDSAVVSGLGASGACDGDSGGPLLTRNASGNVVVGGVLSTGSASCLHEDRYVRVDRVRSWLLDVSGASVTSGGGCGGIDDVGRCLYGGAFFCRGETLVAEQCSGAERCGFSPEQAGFRCVAPGNDPCSGVDSLGACRGDRTLRCNAGVLEQQRCGCGHTCRIDGRTGGPLCTD